jgi:hypothetical protein
LKVGRPLPPLGRAITDCTPRSSSPRRERRSYPALNLTPCGTQSAHRQRAYRLCASRSSANARRLSFFVIGPM